MRRLCVLALIRGCGTMQLQVSWWISAVPSPGAAHIASSIAFWQKNRSKYDPSADCWNKEGAVQFRDLQICESFPGSSSSFSKATSTRLRPSEVTKLTPGKKCRLLTLASIITRCENSLAFPPRQHQHARAPRPLQSERPCHASGGRAKVASNASDWKPQFSPCGELTPNALSSPKFLACFSACAPCHFRGIDVSHLSQPSQREEIPQWSLATRFLTQNEKLARLGPPSRPID